MAQSAARRLLLAQCVSNLFMDCLCFLFMALKGLYMFTWVQICMDIILLVMAAEHKEKKAAPHFEVASHVNIELLVARGIGLVTAFGGQYTGLFAALEGKTERQSGPDVFTCVALFLALYVAVDFVAYKYARVDSSSDDVMVHNKWRIACACAQVAAQFLAVALDSLIRDVDGVHAAEPAARFIAGSVVGSLCVVWMAYKRLFRNSSLSDLWRQNVLTALCVVTASLQAGFVAYVSSARGAQAALGDALALAYVVALLGADNVLLMRVKDTFGKEKTHAGGGSKASFYDRAAEMYRKSAGKFGAAAGAGASLHKRLPQFSGERFATALRNKYSSNNM